MLLNLSLRREMFIYLFYFDRRNVYLCFLFICGNLDLLYFIFLNTFVYFLAIKFKQILIDLRIILCYFI